MFDADHAAFGGDQVSRCPTLDVGFSVATYYDLAAHFNVEPLPGTFLESFAMLDA